jgi:glucose-1-phosphate cytidylyltransferase
MVQIGYRPILWQIMKYYAHYGHKDFILCLGYKADTIKNFFLQYDECVSNNFSISNGGKDVTLLSSDIDDWKITCIDTGMAANIGQRLKSVEEHLAGEDVFLANYTDGLTNLPLPIYIDEFQRSGKIGSFVCIKPPQSFHVVSTMADAVTDIRHINNCGLWMNGGYFIFHQDIFDYIKDGEDLVNEPFQRLITQKQLMAYKYDGFFACMDTFKEKQLLEDMYTRGDTPWEVWKPIKLQERRRRCLD